MILVYYANRAEKSILDPIVNNLAKKNIKHEYINISVHVEDITDDRNLSKIYDFVYNAIDNYNEKIDCAIIIGDRREIMFASLALFMKAVPIVQLAAGDLSEKISLVDDYFRHLITLLSDQQVCFSSKSLDNSDNLRNILNLKNNSVKLANPTLSDIDAESIKLENSNKYYDLVLMHPQSLSRENTINDMLKVSSLIESNKDTVIIRGNKDKNFDILYNLWTSLEEHKNISLYDNLEKEEFINLLANCDRFITNSSCSFYEAPLFLKSEKIIHVGERNKNREILNYTFEDMNSSEKIVNFILGDK